MPPRPSADTPAGIRFLGEFDNILLSHANRNRILRDEDRKQVFTRNGLVRPTILLDGFVRGTWQLQQKSKTATLTIAAFQLCSDSERQAIAEEGMKLLRFAAPDADAYHLIVNSIATEPCRKKSTT
nr:crosslink repair DNA glycosylase YcaQ family protein [Paenibacillus sp. HB172176]